MTGLVQLGSSAFADRYTYIPHIGLFIACAWLLRAVAHFNLGIGYVQEGNLEQAASQFLASTTIDPNFQPALQNLGASLIHLGRFSEAEPVLVRLAALAPENPVAHEGLARIVYARGQCEDAVRYARTALRLHYEGTGPEGIIRACAHRGG